MLETDWEAAGLGIRLVPKHVRCARFGRGVGWDFSVGSGYLLPNCAYCARLGVSTFHCFLSARNLSLHFFGTDCAQAFNLPSCPNVRNTHGSVGGTLRQRNATDERRAAEGSEQGDAGDGSDEAAGGGGCASARGAGGETAVWRGGAG
eukprot:COSAG02_NODE_4095_length_5788_cov_3.722271_7_plen_148_part_00